VDAVQRTYRNLRYPGSLIRFAVKISETDLFILADRDLTPEATDSVLRCRSRIEEYISLRPEFQTSLSPVEDDPYAPDIVREMMAVSRSAGVGPMAAVAGAIAAHVGRDLERHSMNVIVENGGDIYLNTKEDISVGIGAGQSPFSGKLALRLAASDMPLGVCTSSGTVGHSLSFGAADAICVKSGSAALADAVATAVGNRVRGKEDVRKAIEFGMSVEGVLGVLVVIGDVMAAMGSMELAETAG